jgi:hypothetical protein
MDEMKSVGFKLAKSFHDELSRRRFNWGDLLLQLNAAVAMYLTATEADREKITTLTANALRNRHTGSVLKMVREAASRPQ